jgi:hypothetical protein
VHVSESVLLLKLKVDGRGEDFSDACEVAREDSREMGVFSPGLFSDQVHLRCHKKMVSTALGLLT